jgi:hypothetical protein
LLAGNLSQLNDLSLFLIDAYRMVDKPYSTDMWMEGAFRHPIGIPDDIFPDAWRGFGMPASEESER